MIMSLPLCDEDDCKTCTYIKDLKQNPTVAACLAGRPYKQDRNFVEELKVPTDVYQTHATAIAANNGTHRTHFDNLGHYE